MRGLINIFIKRPVTVIMILAAQIIAAVFSLFTLPVNRLPDFSVPRVTVETVYHGMAANELRTLVTIPLEDGLSPVKGLERMRSVSRDNRSIISMDFRWGTDPMSASVLVREAIDAVYPSLPEGVQKPSVTSGDSGNEPHAVIAVSSHNGNSVFARNLAEYELRSRLRRIDGVGSVVLAGGEVIEERLSLDTPRLAALGISPSELAGLIAQETADIPAGNAREGNMELIVISSGRPDSTASLSQIILPLAGGTLTIGDTGDLRSSTARRESIFVYNGKEAASLEIFRRPGADPLRLSGEIRKTIDEAALLFSRDAQIEIVTDSSPSLLSGITNLCFSAALGASAVFAVLLIFIRRLKYSVFASLSIPVSAAAGICVLSITGRSLNSMSLAGLAMGIGLVSDISVIVLNLLHRAFGKRDSVPDPQEIGNKVFTISGSSIASTLTTGLVFIPVIFLPGPLGSLFGDIAVALVTSVAAGWLYAQFCLPALYRMFFDSFSFDSFSAVKKFILNGIKSACFFKKRQIFGSSLLTKIKTLYIRRILSNGTMEKKYAGFLLSLIRKPEKFFIIAVFLVITGTVFLLMRPMVFVNPDESEEVLVSLFYPPGILLETAAVTGKEISRLVTELPFVKAIYGKAGAEEEDISRRADINYTKEEFVFRFLLKKGTKPDKALADINETVSAALQNKGIPFSAYFPKDKTEILLGLSAERTFVISGKDRDELLERKAAVEEALNTSLIGVSFRPQGQRPELRLFPDREASAYLSISAAQIAEALYVLNEGIIASRLEIEGRPLDVRVTGEREMHGDPVQRLEQMLLKTPQGKTVYLGSLGRIERTEAESSLARLDRSDVIYADAPEEKKKLAQINIIASQFSWFTGANESVFSRYKSSLLIYIFLVLILLYMAMGAQFESFLLPLILMLSIPFSLAGAGPALFISGSKIDSGAVLGLTALFGLVVNNSLILFEVSDQKIHCGLSPAAAVLQGACERFQAIIITTTTTIFALLPLMLSPMGNSQKSMAAAMLGGLTASTLLSLFAIPPVLIRFFKWKHQKEEKIK